MSTGPGASGGFRSSGPAPRVPRQTTPPAPRRRPTATGPSPRAPATSTSRSTDAPPRPRPAAPRRPARPRSPSAGCPVAAASRWRPSATRSTTRSTAPPTRTSRRLAGPRSRHGPGRRRPRRACAPSARRPTWPAARRRSAPARPSPSSTSSTPTARPASRAGSSRACVAMTVVALGVLGVYSVRLARRRRRPRRRRRRRRAPRRRRPRRRPRRCPSCPARRSTSRPRPRRPVRVPGHRAQRHRRSTAWPRRSPRPSAPAAGRPRASAATRPTTSPPPRSSSPRATRPSARRPSSSSTQFPQLQGPAPRFFELPADVTAPGLVVVADRRLAALIRRLRPLTPAARNTRRPPSVGRCVRSLRGLVRPRPRPGARATLAALLAAPAARRRRSCSRRRAAAADDVRTEDARVPSGSGADAVELDTTLYLPGRRTSRAPAVVLAHGFGGSKDSVADDARDLAERGYVVLTYSARGFGRSTGQIGLDDPRYEVADLSTLIDLLAERDDVAARRRRRPAGRRRRRLLRRRAGAARRRLRRPHRRDRAADHLELPDRGALPVPDRRGRRADGRRHPAGRATPASTSGCGPGSSSASARRPPAACSTPSAAGTAPRADRARAASTRPSLDPAVVEQALTCGRFRADICAAYQTAAATGTLTPEIAAVLDRSSPAGVLDRIDGADAAGPGHPGLAVRPRPGRRQRPRHRRERHRRSRSSGTPAGTTRRPRTGSPPNLRDQVAGWFDFHLRGEGADPGTGFEFPAPTGLGSTGGVGRVQGGNQTVVADALPRPGRRATPAERADVALERPDPAGRHPRRRHAGRAHHGARPRLARPPPWAARRWRSPASSPPSTASRSTPPSRSSAPRPSRSPSPRPAARPRCSPSSTTSRPAARTTLPAGPGRAAGADRPVDRPGAADARSTVTLPGIVHRFEAGHTMRLVVSSTDQAFALPAEPAVYSVGLAGDGVGARRARGRRPDAGRRRLLPLVGAARRARRARPARLGRRRCCGAGAAAGRCRPSSPTARTCRCASRA